MLNLDVLLFKKNPPSNSALKPFSSDAFLFFFVSLNGAFEPFFFAKLYSVYIPVMSNIFVLINATVFLCEYCCRRATVGSEQCVLLCKLVLNKVFSRPFLPAPTPPYCPRDPPRPIPIVWNRLPHPVCRRREPNAGPKEGNWY